MVESRAGVAQWESEGLIIPRPWVRFPPPAPFHLPALTLPLNNLTQSRALVLVNPAAGAGRAKAAAARVAAYFKTQSFAVEFVEPRGAAELERTAREAMQSGGRLVVALGGDGTFQSVANAGLGTDAVLGLLPTGGGNDFAAALGIPGDPVAAAHVMLHGTPLAVDVLRARTSDGHTRCYVGGGGLGLDAEAARLAAGLFRRLPGAARYVASALRALASFQPLEVEAELDGESSRRVRARAVCDRSEHAFVRRGRQDRSRCARGRWPAQSRSHRRAHSAAGPGTDSAHSAHRRFTHAGDSALYRAASVLAGREPCHLPRRRRNHRRRSRGGRSDPAGDSRSRAEPERGNIGELLFGTLAVKFQAEDDVFARVEAEIGR